MGFDIYFLDILKFKSNFFAESNSVKFGHIGFVYWDMGWEGGGGGY